MSVRDDLHRLVQDLPEDDLMQARAFLESLGEKGGNEIPSEDFGAGLVATTDAWQREAIRAGLGYAAGPAAEWVDQADMETWLQSWGTRRELPPPDSRPRG